MLQQEPERGVHLVGLDQLVVVQDQQHLLTGLGGQLVDQRGHQPLKRGWRRRAEQRGDPLGHARAHLVNGGGDMPPAPGRVVVAGVQRQPGDRPAAGPGPVGQQGGLAEPGRRAHQQQPPRQPLLQPLQQTGAGHEARRRAGHMQLGGQQSIGLAGARLRDGRSGRFGHRVLPRHRHTPGWDPGTPAHCRAPAAGAPTAVAPHRDGSLPIRALPPSG